MLIRDVERTRPLIALMEEIAAAHEATLSQVALNWLIHANDDLVVTIPGATRVAQAQENAAAMRFVLTPDEIARLSEASSRLQN